MVKATAADGKTPLHSVIGEGIFVSAVEFNKLYALATSLEKQVAESIELIKLYSTYKDTITDN
jgi:hypothetical protein